MLKINKQLNPGTIPRTADIEKTPDEVNLNSRRQNNDENLSHGPPDYVGMIILQKIVVASFSTSGMMLELQHVVYVSLY